MDIPNRCIWCLTKSPGVIFDISHVVPECLGNTQQTLPEGIVCKQCNQYFGTKVEPVLLRDPLFHVIAVALALKDPEDMKEFRNRVFDSEHPSVIGVTRHFDLKMTLLEGDLVLDINHGIKGQMKRHYETRDLAFLSRAIHKIAFESLAWKAYVKSDEVQIDLFDRKFDHVRKWARYGQPPNPVRLVARRQNFENIKANWEYRVWKFGDSLAIELKLFGDWYAVSLTSSPDEASNDLIKWVGSERANDNIWFISDKFFPATHG